MIRNIQCISDLSLLQKNGHVNLIDHVRNEIIITVPQNMLKRFVHVEGSFVYIVIMIEDVNMYHCLILYISVVVVSVQETQLCLHQELVTMLHGILVASHAVYVKNSW